jgi:hypothetical protein
MQNEFFGKKHSAAFTNQHLQSLKFPASGKKRCVIDRKCKLPDKEV